MKKHYLFIIAYALQCSIATITCPCMPSNKNTEPFFEQEDVSSTEQAEEISEEE